MPMDMAAREHANVVSKTLSIGAQFIHRSLPVITTNCLFDSRDPVHMKVIANHKLKSIFMKETTICSQCKDLIWLKGHNCQQCKLMSHTKCLDSIKASCMIEPSGCARQQTHQFEPTYFKTLTHCQHCGTLLKGVFKRQGVECKACKLAVHFDCQNYVCFECKPRSTTKMPSLDEFKVYDHKSKMSIDDFELIRLIGNGSFSKVYLAKLKANDNHLEEKRFAIKVIKKTNITLGGDPKSVLTEMRALRLGKNYQFLTVAHCCFQSNERLYFVMEHVIGRDLFYHIRKCGKFTEDRAKFYAAEIVLALIFLHKNFVIYRDLKLDNIILDRSGHCKLLDFGMSKELRDSMRTRTFCGTPSYIAPEIIREQDYDYSVDWWSLGVLMYEMMIGCSPFEAEDEDEIYRRILNQEVHFPRTLSHQARSILEGLLERNPQQRLGCHIVYDPFFKFKCDGLIEEYQWDAIEKKRMKPPYMPTGTDLTIESEDKNEGAISLSPMNEESLKRVSHSDFDGFSFYSESFKTHWLSSIMTVG